MRDLKYCLCLSLCLPVCLSMCAFLSTTLTDEWFGRDACGPIGFSNAMMPRVTEGRISYGCWKKLIRVERRVASRRIETDTEITKRTGRRTDRRQIERVKSWLQIVQI